MKVIWTPMAEHRLERIFHFIVNDDRCAAWAVYNDIKNTSYLLIDQPKLGKKSRWQKRWPGSRELVCKKYRSYFIFYNIEKGKIFILNVYRGSEVREPPKPGG